MLATQGLFHPLVRIRPVLSFSPLPLRRCANLRYLQDYFLPVPGVDRLKYLKNSELGSRTSKSLAVVKVLR